MLLREHQDRVLVERIDQAAPGRFGELAQIEPVDLGTQRRLQRLHSHFGHPYRDLTLSH